MSAVAAMLLAACTSPIGETQALGAAHHLTPRVIRAGIFDVFTMTPARWTPDAPLRVYIEGDGYAFITPTRLSDDPTPRHPLVLELAVRDPGANVLYLARPCQYVSGPERRNCHPAFWSVARYGEDVLDAMDAAIDRFKAESAGTRVVLVGYSGGGAIAALLAARRSDVVSFVTIAGVLDTDAWTAIDSSTPLRQSLNPADFAARLSGIPQIHLVGENDTQVPPLVAAAYARHFPASAQPPIRVMPAFDHDCCWVRHWPEILHDRP